MVTINVTRVNSAVIFIGRESEHLYRPLRIDCSFWISKQEDCDIVAFFQPNGFDQPYPVTLIGNDNYRYWRPEESELIRGVGELQLFSEFSDGSKGSSPVYKVSTDRSLVKPSTHPEDFQPSWAFDMLKKVSEGVSHYPKVGENGNWLVWDVELEDWADTGHSAGDGSYAEPFVIHATNVEAASSDGEWTFDVEESGAEIWAHHGNLQLDIQIPGAASVLLEDSMAVPGRVGHDEPNGVFFAMTFGSTNMSFHVMILDDEHVIGYVTSAEFAETKDIPTEVVLYTPQTLTPAQQEQARSNIDATKLFVVRIASESDPLTANKTFAETYAAIQNGMLVRADLWTMDSDLWLDCLYRDETQIIFGGDALGTQLTLVFKPDESLTQTFSQIPTNNNQLENGAGYQTAQDVQDAISQIGTVFTLKGGVVTVNDLPQTGNRIGDVWYVESVSAGFIWITSTAYPDGYWEELGETVDLSAYAEKTWVQNQGYQTAQQVQTAISGVRQLPTGGSVGDFLRKDSNGNAAWETVQTYQGGSY